MGTNEDSAPGTARLAGPPGPLLSVVVPTFKERDNVGLLVGKLDRALRGLAWEVIFVDDDSPDGTWSEVRRLAVLDARVRCVRRIGRRGLAGACIEGMLSSSATYLAVMDADLQHDETYLPKMLNVCNAGHADLVVGSRYVEGGTAAGFTRLRLSVSRLSNAIARELLKVDLADPMSGFFMIRREKFEPLAAALSTQGFKILLDIVATAKGSLRIVELPYSFGSRLYGESKLSSIVALDFLGLVIAKLTRDVVSLRFVLFALIGIFGVLVNLAALFASLDLAGLSFAQAQSVGAVLAMTSNFALNNRLTYRDQRLTGLDFLRGLVSFYLVCSVGALANVGVAYSLYDQRPSWWLAGVAGALMGGVWNYAMSSVLVWRTR